MSHYASAVEIVTADDASNGDLVEVAFADNREEAESIQELLQNGGIPSQLRSILPNGPLLGIGLLPRSPQRILVHTGQADAAHQLLDETLVEGTSDAAAAIAETRFSDDGVGKTPRNYSLLGAYARAWFWSVGVVVVAFGVFLLHHLT